MSGASMSADDPARYSLADFFRSFEDDPFAADPDFDHSRWMSDSVRSQ